MPASRVPKKKCRLEMSAIEILRGGSAASKRRWSDPTRVVDRSGAGGALESSAAGSTTAVAGVDLLAVCVGARTSPGLGRSGSTSSDPCPRRSRPARSRSCRWSRRSPCSRGDIRERRVWGRRTRLRPGRSRQALRRACLRGAAAPFPAQAAARALGTGAPGGPPGPAVRGPAAAPASAAASCRGSNWISVKTTASGSSTWNHMLRLLRRAGVPGQEGERVGRGGGVVAGARLPLRLRRQEHAATRPPAPRASTSSSDAAVAARTRATSAAVTNGARLPKLLRTYEAIAAIHSSGFVPIGIITPALYSLPVDRARRARAAAP